MLKVLNLQTRLVKNYFSALQCMRSLQILSFLPRTDAFYTMGLSNSASKSITKNLTEPCYYFDFPVNQ